MDLLFVKFSPDQDHRRWICLKNVNYVWVSGHAFCGDGFCEAIDIAQLFSEIGPFNPQRYMRAVSQFNGNFAVVIQGRDGFFASVDQIRSIPLFFAQINSRVYLSDDAKWVFRHLDTDDMDPRLRQEFLLTGYVTGGDTLYDGLKQLRAGECFWGRFNSTTELSLSKRRYFRYYNEQLICDSTDALIERLDAILLRSFERLARSTQERTLILPLSGGLDSRLVTLMVKRLGYDNVICYSYGRPGNKDTTRSKTVAEKLDFTWMYVPYSRKKWRQWYRTEQWKRYVSFAGNFTSVPHIDEWAAVWDLKKNGRIPEDAIFVPGHTGDFISGGHTAYLFNTPGEVGERKLTDSILRKHYGLWPELLNDAQIKRAMEERIRESLAGLAMETNQGLASAYEYWEWQERQAKFILNSLRVYDFWGYDWRVPLWDLEMMAFWSRVPYRLKLGKHLYKSYLKTRDMYEIYNDLVPEPKPLDSSIKKLLKRISPVAKFISQTASSIQNWQRRYLEYFDDPLGVLGIYDYLTVTFDHHNRRNINSILVKDYLKSLSDSRLISSSREKGS